MEEKGLTYYFENLTYISPQQLYNDSPEINYKNFNLYVIVKRDNLFIKSIDRNGKLGYTVNDRFTIETEIDYKSQTFSEDRNGIWRCNEYKVDQVEIINSLVNNNFDVNLEFEILYIGISDREKNDIKSRLIHHEKLQRITIDHCGDTKSSLGIFLLSTSTECMKAMSKNNYEMIIENDKNIDLSELRLIEEILIRKFKPKYYEKFNNDISILKSKNGNVLKRNNIKFIQLIADYYCKFSIKIYTTNFEICFGNFFACTLNCSDLNSKFDPTLQKKYY